MLPFLKWPGGKRWFVAEHAHLLPTTYERYIEPFLGSGAVYFHLEPRKALLGDANEDLVETYRAIKKDPAGVERHLRRHHRDHDAEYYYAVRDGLMRTGVTRAARFVYLNRTCFNGIYRVNLQGKFNVPVGTKTAVVLDTDDFHATARLLRRAAIRDGDFEPLIDAAEGGDLVFADPPYTVRHNNNGFVKYNETLFSWSDQERLARALVRAARRGAKVVATNAAHDEVRSLYPQPTFFLTEVERYSAISSDSASRRAYREVVIRANCE
jgi:DNA adenine methylase